MAERGPPIPPSSNRSLPPPAVQQSQKGSESSKSERDDSSVRSKRYKLSPVDESELMNSKEADSEPVHTEHNWEPDKTKMGVHVSVHCEIEEKSLRMAKASKAEDAEEASDIKKRPMGSGSQQTPTETIESFKEIIESKTPEDAERELQKTVRSLPKENKKETGFLSYFNSKEKDKPATENSGTKDKDNDKNKTETNDKFEKEKGSKENVTKNPKGNAKGKIEEKIKKDKGKDENLSKEKAGQGKVKQEKGSKKKTEQVKSKKEKQTEEKVKQEQIKQKKESEEKLKKEKLSEHKVEQENMKQGKECKEKDEKNKVTKGADQQKKIRDEARESVELKPTNNDAEPSENSEQKRLKREDEVNVALAKCEEDRKDKKASNANETKNNNESVAGETDQNIDEKKGKENEGHARSEENLTASSKPVPPTMQPSQDVHIIPEEIMKALQALPAGIPDADHDTPSKSILKKRGSQGSRKDRRVEFSGAPSKQVDVPSKDDSRSSTWNTRDLHFPYEEAEDTETSSRVTTPTTSSVSDSSGSALSTHSASSALKIPSMCKEMKHDNHRSIGTCTSDEAILGDIPMSFNWDEINPSTITQIVADAHLIMKVVFVDMKNKATQVEEYQQRSGTSNASKRAKDNISKDVKNTKGAQTI